MNLMLLKKFFNIIIIFNKTVFIKMIKLCLKSTAMIKRVLYVIKCS